MNQQVEAIHKAVEFIEQHLRDEITVADIAAAAGYSLYHFIRTFNQTVHHTPYNYLMRRRLSEAARLLLGSSARIIDISVTYCFNNQETFSRAFKRMFNIQPSQWREGGIIPHGALMPALTLDYLVYINQETYFRPEVVERGESYLLGLMSDRPESPLQLWDSLVSVLREIEIVRHERQIVAVSSFLPAQAQPAFHFLGVETQLGGTAFPPLVCQTLSAGHWARIIHQGAPGQLLLALDYFYSTWLPNSAYPAAYPMQVEWIGTQLPKNDNGTREILIPLERVE